MSPLDTRCLDSFPDWLKTLSDDALALAADLEDEEASTAGPVRRHVTGALTYLFKSLDLIPDGIEDLGYLDDAFVFRAASALAVREGGASDTLQRLGKEAELVREFLGQDYARLETFVAALGTSAARGRSVASILEDAAVRAAFVSDVKGWAGSYAVPSFGRDVKNLVKLKSFLTTKLPA